MEWARLPAGGDATSLTIRDGICCVIGKIVGAAHTLFRAEHDALGSVAASRAADFAAGRHFARAGLGHFGVAPVALPIGPGRAPVWPPGFVGSIAHGAGLAGAVVTHSHRYRSLGLDIERRGAVTPQLYPILFTANERAHPIDPELATLLFSAKETIYKAAYPLLRRWIGFEEVSIHVDPTSASFRFQPEQPDSDLAPLADGEGAFSLQDDVVLTLFRLGPNGTGITLLSDHAEAPAASATCRP